MQHKTLFGTALFAAALAMDGPGNASASEVSNPATQSGTADMHPYVGMWVTGDGRIRQELLANGRYNEARGQRRSAYQGRYEVKGNRIDYWDDTGFTADGVFVDDNTLHHGGMIFFREPPLSR
jgi:hypothetical protein